jgi:hypothetical protein
MFQMSLEPSLLVSLFDTIRTILDHNRGDANIIRQAEEYMKALASVPRFSTVWLFLDKTEKGYAKDVWRMLGVDNPGTIWAV